MVFLIIFDSVLFAIMFQMGLLGIHTSPFPYIGGLLFILFADTIYIIIVNHPVIASIVVSGTIFKHGTLYLPSLLKEFACFITFMEVIFYSYLH